ncbi:hypothetical protein Q31b_19950 [Novipirellula aureliae]|uniref:SLA1 homology domain-containing protein n=1 Tax=Novipirellula aureliae TaxID=2527966 RepID=A0A5C6E5Q9_9BACT|nr:SHD1 domain-containing protein [Novipirellula aureliae]TWU42961.1 hypothetical protein Q31b_19950 [Novipirellula aureliae]
MVNLKHLGVFAMGAIVCCTCSVSARAASLGYQWKNGQRFSYQFEVTVEMDDETITYKGITHYTVNTVNAEQAIVTYRGGLNESKKMKQSNRGGPFGRRGFPGPPSIPSPFSRPTFAGKTQTTNKITITPSGETLAMQGDSQLPYLLGNVSLMPFERLPRDERREWTIDNGVSISETNEDRRNRFGPFGPGGPFGGNQDRNVQAAGEVANYTIQSENGDLVVIKKSYRLTTPQTGDNPAFDMTGNGTWTFDRKENVPHAFDMNIELTIKSGNSSVVLPISIKYDRISAEKIAEMEAAAKAKADAMAKAAAEKLALAKAPLTPQEKRDALASLSGRDAKNIQTTLGQLAAKSPEDPDPEMAAAIEQHIDNPDKAVSAAAQKALVKWSPSYALKKKLAKAYQGPGVLSSTGLVVESITPLFVGQLVQAQKPRYGSFWRAAKVKKLLPDGQVELAFLTWGKEDGAVAVARRNIQLAPPELDQPDKPANIDTLKSESRTWSDATGRFKTDAVFLSAADGTVNLRRSDGRTLSVPLEKLSEADQAFVKQLEDSENPFKLD